MTPGTHRRPMSSRVKGVARRTHQGGFLFERIEDPSWRCDYVRVKKCKKEDLRGEGNKTELSKQSSRPPNWKKGPWIKGETDVS